MQIIKDVRTKVTQNNLNELADYIIKIKGFTGKIAAQITGSGCSDCSCHATTTPGGDIPGCVFYWDAARNAFEIQGKNLGIITTLIEFKKDAFGSPYLLDENEGEMGINDYRLDGIRSAGPDQIAWNADDLYPYNLSSTFYIINTTPICTGQ